MLRGKIAGILKDAMRRLARKEIRAETRKTNQAVAQYRRDIARLKREANLLSASPQPTMSSGPTDPVWQTNVSDSREKNYGTIEVA